LQAKGGRGKGGRKKKRRVRGFQLGISDRNGHPLGRPNADCLPVVGGGGGKEGRGEKKRRQQVEGNNCHNFWNLRFQ